jgi:hypothetical protein
MPAEGGSEGVNDPSSPNTSSFVATVHVAHSVTAKGPVFVGVLVQSSLVGESGEEQEHSIGVQFFACAEPHVLHVHAQDIVAKLKAELAACRNDSTASSSDGTPSRLSSGKTVRVGGDRGTPRGKFDPVAYTAKMQEKKEAAKHAKLERR